jgi:uncharacterized membrane protein YgdD (TMEM256/DUF423 family)
METSDKVLRKYASILGATGVGLGAFGAHGLKKNLESKPNALENWRTAVAYQLFHAVAILGLSAIQQQNFNQRIHNKQVDSSLLTTATAGQLMGFGTILFSGSIYLLTLDIGPRRILGPTTPIGGLLIIAGWVVAGIA